MIIVSPDFNLIPIQQFHPQSKYSPTWINKKKNKNMTNFYKVMDFLNDL